MLLELGGGVLFLEELPLLLLLLEELLSLLLEVLLSLLLLELLLFLLQFTHDRVEGARCLHGNILHMDIGEGRGGADGTQRGRGG